MWQRDPEMRFKKYIVFGFDQYYPLGGLEDIRGDFDTLEEAWEYDHDWDYHYIVDRDTWQKVNADSQ